MDMMEKRVKSRFSQNIVNIAFPNTFDGYRKIIEHALLIGANGQSMLVRKYRSSVIVSFLFLIADLIS